jgi:hypothetical protein
MVDFDEGAEDEDLFALDLPAAPEPPADPQLEMVKALNALSPKDALNVVDTALGKTAALPDGSPTELSELLSVVREFGPAAMHRAAAQPASAEREPVDYSRMSAADMDRVTDAVLSGTRLDANDPLASIVDAQLADAEAWQAALDG